MYAFIDDSGDAGMKFCRGSSTHLVFAMCIFKTEQAWLATEQTLLNMPEYLKSAGEFKHAKMKEQHRNTFFTLLENEDFYVRVIIVDKQRLTSQFLATHANEMKTYFIMQLLTHVFGQVKDCHIFIDGADLRAFGVKSTEYLLNRLNSYGQKNIASQIECVDSRQSVGLQLADMVAGTVMAGIKKGPRITETARWTQVRRRAKQPEGTWWDFTRQRK
ncbi:DUF3800 domain-containing protein [Trueperella pyogenes]|uniref:DUF3800 domain-containing protein n=1 Tax=Trueperella pyogenes TaxID=1661 RepID=UPI00345E0086